MSTPTFYWYPDRTGTLQRTDLGLPLTDLQEVPRADVEDVYTGDGVPYRSHLATTQRFRILLDRFAEAGGGVSAVERELIALQSHLFRGGLVGFSRDHARTWARSLTAPSRGDDSFVGNTNVFAPWSSSATLSAGDELVVETIHPEARSEVASFAAFGVFPDSTDLADGLIYSYTLDAVLRWRDFYPVCWLPKDQVGQPIVTHDGRITWTLDVTLEYSLGATRSLWAAGTPALRDTSTGSSLEQLVRGA